MLKIVLLGGCDLLNSIIFFLKTGRKTVHCCSEVHPDECVKKDCCNPCDNGGCSSLFMID